MWVTSTSIRTKAHEVPEGPRAVGLCQKLPPGTSLEHPSCKSEATWGVGDKALVWGSRVGTGGAQRKVQAGVCWLPAVCRLDQLGPRRASADLELVVNI